MANTPQPDRSLDAALRETEAMGHIYRVLSSFDTAARQRILDWVESATFEKE